MTPLIEPGVDATPIMTWGEIEGTPMILGAHMTPGADPRKTEPCGQGLLDKLTN